jgi:hypothetical protein
MQLVGYAGARKIEKVTAAQDDGFVGGLEVQLVGYAENTKDLKTHSCSSG